MASADSKNPNPAKHRLTFLRNHREAIAAMVFFTVSTLTFGVLYSFFVIWPGIGGLPSMSATAMKIGLQLTLRQLYQPGSTLIVPIRTARASSSSKTEPVD